MNFIKDFRLLLEHLGEEAAPPTSASDVQQSSWKPVPDSKSKQSELVQPDADTGAAGITLIDMFESKELTDGLMTPVFAGVASVATDKTLRLSFVIEHSFPNGLEGEIPELSVQVRYGTTSKVRHNIPIITDRQEINIPLDSDFPYGTAEGFLVPSVTVATVNNNTSIFINLNTIEVLLVGVLYEVIRKQIIAYADYDDGNILTLIENARYVE